MPETSVLSPQSAIRILPTAPTNSVLPSSSTIVAAAAGAALMASSGEGGVDVNAVPASSTAYTRIVGTDGFRESDLFYIKEPFLSRKQHFKKYIALAFPILLAICVVGGLAWYSTRDFNHYLYPGQNSGSGENKRKAPIYNRGSSAGEVHSSSITSDRPLIPKGEHIAGPDSPSFTLSAPSTKSSTSEESSCTAHSKCEDIGLMGECCPTEEGTFLRCC
jgi:hypothetical protein